MERQKLEQEIERVVDSIRRDNPPRRAPMVITGLFAFAAGLLTAITMRPADLEPTRTTSEHNEPARAAAVDVKLPEIELHYQPQGEKNHGQPSI